MKVCKVFFREKELKEKKRKEKKRKGKEKEKEKLFIIYFIINDFDYSLFSLKIET